MQGKYSVIVLIIILHTTLLFAAEDKRITLFMLTPSLRNPNISEYMFDKAQTRAISTEGFTIYRYNRSDLSDITRRSVISYNIRSGMDGFIIIEAFDNTHDLTLNIESISSNSETLYKESLVINIQDISRAPLNTLIMDEWTSKIDGALLSIMNREEPNRRVMPLFDFNTQSRDFPIVNINASIISAKIFFDDRINSKVFSVFPINLNISFFPLKHLEAGLYVTFNFDNVIYNYYDMNLNKFDIYNNNYSINYGLSLGVCFHTQNNYFATGIRFGNLFYVLPEQSDMIKTDDYRSFWIPMLAIYQKIEFKLFKFINYSIAVSIRTLPLFIKNGNYFYTEPFKYDFVIVDFTFFGLSITF